MYEKIKIADREIEMAANAASPFIYGKLFHEDFENSASSIESWRKMAFVMAKQAEIGEIELYNGKITEQDLVEWLAQFDPMDFSEIIEKASNLYTRQKKTKSNPKEKAV